MIDQRRVLSRSAADDPPYKNRVRADFVLLIDVALYEGGCVFDDWHAARRHRIAYIGELLGRFACEQISEMRLIVC